jgi:ribosomal protein L15
MTKMEALQHLQTLGITEGDAGYVVANKLAEKAKVAKKGEVKVAATSVKAKATVTAKQLVEAAKA